MCKFIKLVLSILATGLGMGESDNDADNQERDSHD